MHLLSFAFHLPQTPCALHGGHIPDSQMPWLAWGPPGASVSLTVAAGLQTRPVQLSVAHDWSGVELHQLSTERGWGVGLLGPLKTELGWHTWGRGCSHLNSNKSNYNLWPGLDCRHCNILQLRRARCKQAICLYTTLTSSRNSISKYTFYVPV